MRLDIQKTVDAKPAFWTKDLKGNYIPKENIEETITYVLTKPNINFLDIVSRQFCQPVGALKAQEFFWGLMGYLISPGIGINSNGYYLDLMRLDIQKTTDANPAFWTKDLKGNYIPKENIEDTIT